MTKSKLRLRVWITRRTRVAAMRSRPSGWVGAARIITELGCRVSSVWSSAKSRCSSESAASAMVCSGMSCIVMATSPKARSRSTTHTSAPAWSRAMPRLTAIVVLPTPPFGENTVITRPSRSAACEGVR